MFAILTSILPIFLIIALGHLLRRGGIPSTEFWNLNDKLVYWVLMPCLMFNKISVASLSSAALSDYALTLLGGLAAAVIFALIASRVMGYPPARATSVLQGAARHNSFIGLALAANLFGPQGFETAILASAILIPVTNVTIVVLMVTALQPGRRGSLPLAILRDLARNPHIISISLALLANRFVDQEVPVLHEMTGILGAAALPITLLAVGANLRVRAMAASVTPLALAFIGKLLVYPAVTLAIGLTLGLPEDTLEIALVYSLVPTGVTAYTYARQLGGDAPLMAAIVTLQTLAALLTIPLSLYILLPLI
ncbi:AEC family transporter [Ruegeria sp. HKCCD8929]|uniref:AEC family transporter n=1 Tax=Ruegeria sp. HKCCD8929 TaxID=2683006 RepID=UPI0014890EFB|nr:AEC family transporter [Ruegeria sp. HKCCD8929]